MENVTEHILGRPIAGKTFAYDISPILTYRRDMELKNAIAEEYNGLSKMYKNLYANIPDFWPEFIESYPYSPAYHLKSSKGDVPDKVRPPDFKDVKEMVCKVLERALNLEDESLDKERIKKSLDSLRAAKSEEEVNEALMHLCKKGDLMAMLAKLTDGVAGVKSGVDSCGEKLDDLKRRKRTQAKKPSTGKKRWKGRKTSFMAKQLRTFKAYLKEIRFKGEEGKLYGLATSCWSRNQKPWNKAMKSDGDKRGYSCPKALADAYKNTL